jgi:hypothetical protein
MSRNTLLRNEYIYQLGQEATEPLLRRRTRRILLVLLTLGVIAMTAAGLQSWKLCVEMVLPLVIHQGAFRWLAWRGTRAWRSRRPTYWTNSSSSKYTTPTAAPTA